MNSETERLARLMVQADQRAQAFDAVEQWSDAAGWLEVRETLCDRRYVLLRMLWHPYQLEHQGRQLLHRQSA